MLAISELHTRMLHDTPSRRLARNGLALRTGRVPSVRRYLEGRARIVFGSSGYLLTAEVRLTMPSGHWRIQSVTER